MTPEREFYARDRRQLLKRWSNWSGKPIPRRPVQALVGVLEILGYRVVEGPLPEDLIGWTDFARSEIVIAENLAEKLDFPGANLGAIRNSTLGHELGHVRGIDDCSECNTYAAVFLVPYREVQTHPALGALRSAATPKHLWSCVFSLARDFGVSGTLMRRALCEFGWCDYQDESKTLTVRPMEARR